MRILKLAVLAGVGAIGLSIPAVAQDHQTHVMSVRLPDGSVGEIRYVGDVPPQVYFDTTPAALPGFFAAASPFAMLDRISAEMDREAAAMFQQVDAVAAQAQSGQPINVAAGNLPPGSQGYSFVSTASGNGYCSESVQITSQGNGEPPKVVRQRSGDCGATAPRGSGTINLPATAAPTAPRPDVIWTSAKGAHPAAGLIHEIPLAPQR